MSESSSKPHLISANTRSSDRFKRDLSAVLSLSSKQLAEISNALGTFPKSSISEREVSALANKLSLDESLVSRSIQVLAYLKYRMLSAEASLDEISAEIIDIVGGEESDENKAREFASLFILSGSDKIEARSRLAFQEPPTFIASKLKPVFATPDGSLDLYGGFLWSISYLDGNHETTTFTFSLSPGELKEVTSGLEEALREIKKIEEHLAKRKHADS